jgi:hypothetical protein
LKTIARLSTRPVTDDSFKDTGKVDLIIGTAFKGENILKPNRIYEIQEVLGELVIVDIGSSGMTGTGVQLWGKDIGTLVECHQTELYCTQEEIQRCTKL